MNSLLWLLLAALLSLATLRLRLRLRTKSLAADSSAFARLSPELVLRIASLLPPTSAGALSLCTKRLYAILAIPYLKCQHGHPPFDTAEFLRLLEPSLPDHIVCYHCGKLHAIKHSKRHVQFDKRCDIKVNDLMWSYIHTGFSYVIFQMVMKRYCQGRDYQSLLELLSYEDSEHHGEIRTKVSSRVVDGSLLVRQQHIFVVHPDNEGSFLLYAKAMICPHIKELRSKQDYNAIGTERYSMVYHPAPDSVVVDYRPTTVECDSCAYQGKTDEGNWSGLICCRKCATEFRALPT